MVLVACAMVFEQGCSLERTRGVLPLNVSQMGFSALDLDHDGTLSLDEIKAGRKQLGLTEEQAVASQLDANSDGVVTTDEFAAMYCNEQVSEQKHGNVQATDRIVDVYLDCPSATGNLANTTCLEGCRAAMTPAAEWAGTNCFRWTVMAIVRVFDSYFSKFTPNQSDWYFETSSGKCLRPSC